jgi:hypothetical protein
MTARNSSELLPSLQVKPRLRIHLDDVGHAATADFVTMIDCSRLLPNAIQHVLNHLYTPYGLENIPPVRSVTIVLRPMGGVAYTTGLNLDEMHKEIHVSLDYLKTKCDQPLLFRDEAIGVVTHEMVHCFQNTCKGTAPGGLIEGMADFVRLRSGLAPPHWKKGTSKDQMGNKWDEGYQKTAWFLEWLEDHRGAGTVSRMNETMGCCKYDEKQFWPGLFGEDIKTLWERYVATWGKEDKDSVDDTVAGTSADTELEIVNLSIEELQEAENDLKQARSV